uniref:Uncharacterized protein n=1 Tax=Caenorhabditis japonica TaxID=281687 RepID=A0A8R1EBS5_CAEJA
CFDNLNTSGGVPSEQMTGNRLHHDDSSSDSDDEANGSGRSNESRPTFYREEVDQAY